MPLVKLFPFKIFYSPEILISHLFICMYLLLSAFCEIIRLQRCCQPCPTGGLHSVPWREMLVPLWPFLACEVWVPVPVGAPSTQMWKLRPGPLKSLG